MAHADETPAANAVRRRTGGERGFTLLELLVALTLLGLILAVLFGELRFATRAWDAADTKAAQTGELLAVHNFVRQRLEQIYLPTVRGDAGGGESLFDGNARSIRFIGVMPANVADGGFYEISMSLVLGETQQDLLVGWTPFVEGAAPAPAAGLDTSRVVLRGVSDLRFSYFGRTSDDVAAQWWDTWPSRDRVPMLVRVEASFAEGDPRRWPELTVAPATAERARRAP